MSIRMEGPALAPRPSHSDSRDPSSSALADLHLEEPPIDLNFEQFFREYARRYMAGDAEAIATDQYAAPFLAVREGRAIAPRARSHSTAR